MTVAELELITAKTREVIDAAEHSTTIIEQSKKWIRLSLSDRH